MASKVYYCDLRTRHGETLLQKLTDFSHDTYNSQT